MSDITITYKMPEDQLEFDSAYHAHTAWAAINNALNCIRQFTKHEIGTADSTIETVRSLLNEAQWKKDF